MKVVGVNPPCFCWDYKPTTAEAGSVSAAGSQNKSIPRDKLLHFVWDNWIPSEMQRRWDTRVLIIWTSADCVNSDGGTWEGKDASDCWQFTCPLGHLLPSDGQGEWMCMNKGQGAETSGLSPGHNGVSNVVA